MRIKQVLSWGPCEAYDTESKIMAVTDGRCELTPLEVLDLDIPATHKIWLLLRPDVFSKQDLHLLACSLAEDVLPKYEGRFPGDNCPRIAIETKRRWVNGDASDDELDSARFAAWSAPGDTSGFAMTACKNLDDVWMASWSHVCLVGFDAIQNRLIEIIRRYLAGRIEGNE